MANNICFILFTNLLAPPLCSYLREIILSVFVIKPNINPIEPNETDGVLDTSLGLYPNFILCIQIHSFSYMVSLLTEMILFQFLLFF